jgi:HK97 family phage prohead protease
MPTAPEAAREEARRGLEWRSEYNRGGTEVGVARARDIANGRNLSEETIRRMVSYFARHEVDKRGEGWSPEEDGYPSAGRIAWALWGGDPGRRWAESLVAELDRTEENSTSQESKGGRNVQTKTFPANTIEVKAASNEAPHGEFTALVSIFNNTDLVGDRVMPGAFGKSLETYNETGRTLPIVWSHDWGNAESFIGKALSAEETEDGLLVRAAFFDTPRAQTVRTLLAERVVNEFSFAYDIINEQKGSDGVNELLELSILEAGPTLKGANPATQLIAAKTAITAKIKAEPGELEEGSWVTWSDGYGRVEYIMTEGSFGVEGDPLSLQATAEDPLAMVRIYTETEGETEEQYQATDFFKGFRFSELELTEEKATEAPAEKARLVNSKAGRTLSQKNENLIKQAKTMLDDVLSSLEGPAEPAKTEEPETVKVKERGMEPEIAVTLLDLAEIEATQHP